MARNPERQEFISNPASRPKEYRDLSGPYAWRVYRAELQGKSRSEARGHGWKVKESSWSGTIQKTQNNLTQQNVARVALRKAEKDNAYGVQIMYTDNNGKTYVSQVLSPDESFQKEVDNFMNNMPVEGSEKLQSKGLKADKYSAVVISK